MNKLVNENSRIKIGGRLYTIPQLQEFFKIDTIKNTISFAQDLIDNKKAGLYETITQEQKQFNNIAKELIIQGIAQEHEQQKEASRNSTAEKKREGYDRFSIEIDFASDYAAKVFQSEIKRDYGMNDSFVASHANGSVFLKINNITERDRIVLERLITRETVKDFAIDSVDKLTTSVVKTGDYVANQVIVPITQIGLRGIGAFIGAATKTVAKVGGTLISSASDSTKKAWQEIKEDPEVIKGAATIIESKDNVVQAFNNCGGVGSNRLRVNR